MGILLFIAPGAVLLLAGLFAAEHPSTKWLALLGVAVAGTAVWLGYVALVPHEDGSHTVFGTTPRYEDGDQMLWFVPISAALVALVAGWFRAARTWAIAAAITLGPLLLAWATTPRGDNDGLWGLIFWMIPLFGFVLAGAAATGRGARFARDRSREARAAA